MHQIQGQVLCAEYEVVNKTDMALACSENLGWLATETLANRTRQHMYSIIHTNRVGYIQVMQGWFNNSKCINIINHSHKSKEKSHLTIFVQTPKIHLIDFSIQ